MFLIKTLILIQLSSYVASDSALLTSCQGHVAGLKSILSVTIIFLCVGSHPSWRGVQEDYINYYALTHSFSDDKMLLCQLLHNSPRAFSEISMRKY